jgi:hypothetical protein
VLRANSLINHLRQDFELKSMTIHKNVNADMHLVKPNRKEKNRLCPRFLSRLYQQGNKSHGLRCHALNLWALGLSCLAQVVLQLHSGPEFRAGAESVAKAVCHVSRNVR